MELSFLVDALKSLLINYTSNNSQIDESLNDLFSSLESKNLNNEIENYAEFILLASCLLYTSPSPRDTERSRMPSSA